MLAVSTDNPHVLVRGKADDGRDLVISSRPQISIPTARRHFDN
jgi:hypothetical protein